MKGGFILVYIFVHMCNASPLAFGRLLRNNNCISFYTSLYLQKRPEQQHDELDILTT